MGSDIKFAALSIFIKNEGVGYFKFTNFGLVELVDAQERQNLPDVVLDHKGVQLLWDYPNSVESIQLSFAQGRLKVISAGKGLRLSNSSPSGEALSIFFDVPISKIGDLGFEDIHSDIMFDSKDFVLMPSSERMEAVVSVDKALLYDAPDLYSVAQMYLVRGDVVSVLEYRHEFIKVAYVSSEGRRVIKWLSLISVI